jgi:hypothetical protein
MGICSSRDVNLVWCKTVGTNCALERWVSSTFCDRLVVLLFPFLGDTFLIVQHAFSPFEWAFRGFVCEAYAF